MPMESIMKQSSVGLVADEETLAESGFYWRERHGARMLVCRRLEEAGFANGFSTRLGGVSSLQGVNSYPGDKGDVSDPDRIAIGTELNLAGFSEDSRENIYEN